MDKGVNKLSSVRYDMRPPAEGEVAASSRVGSVVDIDHIAISIRGRGCSAINVAIRRNVVVENSQDLAGWRIGGDVGR